jgi:tetratricopeptide (TPR) repeat protein
MEKAMAGNPTQRHRFDGRELAAKSASSTILVIVLLFLIRPLMVKQILSRADAYSSCGLYEESKRQCSKVLLIDNNNSAAWYLLGCVHKAEKNTDLAYAAYNKATQIDPANVPAQFDLAMMYAQDGLYKQAIPCFEQVRMCKAEEARKDGHEEFSYHRAALNMLLFCYQKTGDSAKAQLTQQELRVYYPNNVQSTTALAVSDKPEDP